MNALRDGIWRVSGDVEFLWALVAGLLLLVAHAGVVMVVEGLTRRRRVFDVSARHIAGAAGAVVGTLIAMAVDSSFLSSAVSGAASDVGRHPFTALTMAILMTALATAALTERATVLAHLTVGLLTGAILLPAVTAARLDDGLLATISIGTRGFVDTAAVSFFLVSGAVALTGTMVIGPRRGGSGPDGQVRHIPGKSIPTAAVGALLVSTGLIGVLTPIGQVWSDSVADAAVHLLVGGAVGALVGAVIGFALWGWSRSVHVIQGLLAGVVATSGDPFGATVVESIFLAAGGSIVALFVARHLRNVGIDDPVGSVAIYGAAAIYGALGVGFSDGSQFLAQLLGVGMTSVGVLIVSGIVFAILRVLRLLRVRPEIEVVGLEP